MKFGLKRRRDSPKARRSAVVPVKWNVWADDGYKPLSSCPEVQMCTGVYADLIANMTIRLMENTENGDIRVENGLSRKVDIDPNEFQTRHDFIWTIVNCLMTYGNQVTLPVFGKDGLLKELRPLPYGQYSFQEQGDSYVIRYKDKTYKPDEVLHFRLRPNPAKPWMGRGYDIALKDVVKSLNQANHTKDVLMENPAPSLIVKVDGLTEEFASIEGRKALREQYLDVSEKGEPWFIPAEAFDIAQVKPLTMEDLAIAPTMELDKKCVAAMFGVPAFLIGVGAFDSKEYNFFLRTRVMSVAQTIEQELTKKLLISDKMYWRFSEKRLYNYTILETVNAYSKLVQLSAMTRNELRGMVGLDPMDGMDEILALENYLPVDKLGDQKKLKEGEDDEAQE